MSKRDLMDQTPEMFDLTVVMVDVVGVEVVVAKMDAEELYLEL